MVTEGQGDDSDGDYVDPQDIFRTIFLTEGVDAADSVVFASSVGQLISELVFCAKMRV